MDAAELEWVRRARRGDAEAFRSIVEAYSQPLWRAVYRVLGDASLSEDAVQEAFLRAWRALDRFDEQAALSTWLYRIAINAAIDLKRERRRREPFSDALPEDAKGQPVTAATDADPQTRAVWRDLAERAQVALADLSEMERTAILLRHFEGRSIAEVATALGSRQNAAKAAVFRAVQKLRAALGPHMERSRETV